MKKLLLSICFVGVVTLANAQKSEVAEAKKLWNLFQLSLSINPDAGKKDVASDASATINSQSASSAPAGRGVTQYGVNTNRPTGDSAKPKPQAGSATERQLASLNEGLSHIDKAVLHEKTKGLAETWSYKALFASAIALTDTINFENSVSKQKDASEAIAKAKSLDTKGDEKENIASAEINVINAIRTRAVKAYNKKDYANALGMFNELIAINPQDTSMYINAGVTAKLVQKYPEAIQHFNKVISFNAPESKDLYIENINMTLDKIKDTTAALAIIKQALVKFPDDPGLIGAETDLYITQGNIVKSQESLGKLIAKDDKNALYQYLMGDTYYKQALAVQDTRKKLDPKKTKEYDALGSKMGALIDQSLPFYKKSLELNPTYVPALETLKQIYAFKSDNVNYEAIKKRLDAIPVKN